jgi:hypothetical protein
MPLCRRYSAAWPSWQYSLAWTFEVHPIPGLLCERASRALEMGSCIRAGAPGQDIRISSTTLWNPSELSYLAVRYLAEEGVDLALRQKQPPLGHEGAGGGGGGRQPPRPMVVARVPPRHTRASLLAYEFPHNRWAM